MQIWLSFLNFYALGPFGPLFWLVVAYSLTMAIMGVILRGRSH